MMMEKKEKRLDKTEILDELNQYCDQRFAELDKNLYHEFYNQQDSIIKDEAQIFKQYQDMFTNSGEQRIQNITVIRKFLSLIRKLLSLIRKFYILFLKFYILAWNWRLSRRIHPGLGYETDTELVQTCLENRDQERDQYYQELNLSSGTSGFLGTKLAELKHIGQRNINRYLHNINQYETDRKTNVVKIRYKLAQNQWWSKGQPQSPYLPTVSTLLTIWGNIVYAIMYPIVRLWELDWDYRENFNGLKSHIEEFSEPPGKKRSLIRRLISRYVLRRK